MGVRSRRAAVFGLVFAAVAGALMLVWLKRFSFETSEDQAQFSRQILSELDPMLVAGEENKLRFPDLTQPAYASAKDASFLLEDDDVILLRGRSRTLAFPVVMMSWHHIVNEVVDDGPVAITFCVLASTSAIFSRKLADRELSLGVVGNLYFGDMVIYDRATDSRILQATGDFFQGDLKGSKLAAAYRPERMPWRIAQKIPSLQVLMPQRDMEYYRMFYGMNREATHGMKTVTAKGRALDARTVPLQRGLGVSVQGQAAFFPLQFLEAKGVVNDTVGGWSLVAFFDNASQTYSLWRRRVAGKILTFQLHEKGLQDLETRSVWVSSGLAVEGPLKGERLLSPEYVQMFWYNWSAFFPKSELKPMVQME